MKSGIMKMSDLRSYSPQLQAPTRVGYHGLDIFSMASSGTP